MKRRLEVFIILLLILGVGIVSTLSPAEDESPGFNGAFDDYNVVVIVIDTLRADHLGAYGYERDTSPFIDTLAEDGIVFENAYSQSSYTKTSIASMISGKLPTRAGIEGLWAQPPIDEPMLADTFKKNGYRTGLITNTFMVAGGRFSNGYDEVRLSPVGKGPIRRERPRVIPGHGGMEWDDVDVTHQALDFLDEASDEKFFMYIQYLDPHHPYNPPLDYYKRFRDTVYENPLDLPEFRADYDKTVQAGLLPGHPRFDDMVLRYDGEIAFNDLAVQKLVEGLDERGVLGNTIIVITSDHGEEFFEHKYIEHSWSLYQEVLHVPFIFWAGDSSRPGRVTERVSLVDLYPSLMDLMRFERPDSYFDGQSLFVPDANGMQIKPHDDPIIAELITPENCLLRTVIHEDWKYFAAIKWADPADRYFAQMNYKKNHEDIVAGIVESPPIWGKPIVEELYYLKDDPSEQINRIADEPEVLERMRKLLSDYKQQCLTAQGGGNETWILTDEDEEGLNSLGYVQ